MIQKKNILLTTVIKSNDREIYDYFAANARRILFRYSLPRINSFGLRFIKQNIPEIEILEYPTWNQFEQKVNERDWDIVGFSFYQNEIFEILKMAEYCRKKQIPELWAGNYGALSEGIREKFDKVFIGYSEARIAKILGVEFSEENLLHPPLFSNILFNKVKINCQGYLFTNRGCYNKCDFCQTPPFCDKPSKIPIESIDKVLKYYKKLGVNEVIILDESFGLFKSHTDKVINLLDKYGFYWFPMVRADYLYSNLDQWSKKGLFGAMIGIESFNDKTLEKISKNESTHQIIDVIKKLKQLNKMIVGYYMIGFEDDTKESIIRDMKILAKLKLDITQICVVTPLPGTPLWEQIEKKYGIIDKDWHHYNAKHLVWNHPNITPEEMQKILDQTFQIVYPRIRVIETSLGFITRYFDHRGIISGTRYLIQLFMHANKFDHCPKSPYYIENNEKTKTNTSQKIPKIKTQDNIH